MFQRRSRRRARWWATACILIALALYPAHAGAGSKIRGLDELHVQPLPTTEPAPAPIPRFRPDFEPETDEEKSTSEPLLEIWRTAPKMTPVPKVRPEVFLESSEPTTKDSPTKGRLEIWRGLTRQTPTPAVRFPVVVDQIDPGSSEDGPIRSPIRRDEKGPGKALENPVEKMKRENMKKFLDDCIDLVRADRSLTEECLDWLEENWDYPEVGLLARAEALEAELDELERTTNQIEKYLPNKDKAFALVSFYPKHRHEYDRYFIELGSAGKMNLLKLKQYMEADRDGPQLDAFIGIPTVERHNILGGSYPGITKATGPAEQYE